MSVDAEQKCSKCGGVIPAGAAHCPACMLGRAMGGEDSLGDLSDETTSSLDGAPVTEAAGDSIGAYKLLEKIGEGGFGVVYMAKQEKPVRRQVALKIIKLGMDTKQVVGRFEAERQALAMMEHPSIAKVLDAGSTETGRPYFVMELVHGVPITEFCTENRLTTEERLKLFVKVCHAVQHAHQKGVIHRDLKPSNILVTMHDDEAVPKVIDFGIAKATQHDLTDKTLFTQFRHFLGTPAYMSPEQAQMSGLGVDTRSDIYSLGVLLYELLTGCTPLDLKPAMESGYDEVRRTIREEEPMKPSTRVSQLSGGTQTTLSKQLRLSAGALHSQLRGDLDWIVMKAIEKDRTRRYETANSFARDVELFLRDEPVSAVAPSAWYLLSKVVRRHKPIFATLALILPLLILATGISGYLFWKERQTTRDLREERSAKETLNQNLEQTNQDLRENVRRERMARYATDVAAAQNLVASRDFEKAKRILDRYLPVAGEGEDLREFCWYYLMESIEQQQGEQFSKEGARLGSAHFSPDSKWLLTMADSGSRAIVWAVRRKREVVELPLPEDFERVIGRFSSDGRFLMVRNLPNSIPDAGEEFRVLLWRISGKQFEPLPATRYLAWPTERRWNVSSAGLFLPGTSWLALVAERGTEPRAENDVVFYDVESSEIVETLPNAGTILDVSPDGKTLITQRWRQDPPETVIWDVATGMERHRSTQLKPRHLNFFAPDQILISKNSGRMELWDANSFKKLELPLFPLNRVDKLEMSKDGRYFLLIKYRGSDKAFWDSKSGLTVPLPNISAEAAALSPDGSMLAHTLDSGGIALVETDSLGELNRIDRFEEGVLIQELNEFVVRTGEANGSYAYRLPHFESSRLVDPDLIVGYEDEGMYWTRSVDGSETGNRIVRRGGGFTQNEIELDPQQKVRVNLLESGNLFLRYRSPGKLELRDRKTLEVLRERDFSGEKNPLFRGDTVAEFELYIPMHGLSQSIVSISTETLETVEKREREPGGCYLSYVESEHCLVAVHRSGKVQEFSMPEMKLVSEYDIEPSVLFADVSPDGDTIAVVRRPTGDGALELISRRSKLPLMSVGIEDGDLLYSVWFFGATEGDVLVAISGDAIARRSMQWFAAPR